MDPSSNAPLLASADRRRSPVWLVSASAALVVSLLLLVCLVDVSDVADASGGSGSAPAAADAAVTVLSRGPTQGVSEKASGASFLSSYADNGAVDDVGESFPFQWTNDMLQWQRTGFHFQPPQNWMNDPNGPLFYKGWYHLFYQYNPEGAVWGNIAWGHAVSRDLVRWLHLPLAMVPDRWFDANGVWTGSATVLPSGLPVILYTGSTNDSVQVQNLAIPADPSDPLLTRWIKPDSNPVLVPPAGVGPKDFRDPTTAWFDPADGSWRLAIGTKDDADHAGVAIVYRTQNFRDYELLPGLLHRVAGTGMWECVDFYPVDASGAGNGLDTSAAAGDGVRHVLKASMDDDRHDYYAIGMYDAALNRWTPEDPAADVGIGLRYDWGKFYASKTFYDQGKRRRVLWSWIGETDSEMADVQKGWASLQGIPRTVLFDVKTRSNLIQWPVEEIETLRTDSRSFSNISISAGSVVPIDVTMATQVDIVAEFEIKKAALAAAIEADIGYNCSTSGGSSARGMLGPFGLLVLADETMSEQTATYFYVSRGVDGGLRTHFCQDESRSSIASDIVKRVVGSTVPVLDGEKFTLRILVDHSIVESFAQGGRACITSRVYPTRAIYKAARVFLFNNATSAHVLTKSLTIWQMNSTFNRPYYPTRTLNP